MSNPEMKPVTSSNIEAIGHDPDANELHVKFASGQTHIYENVGAATHAALMAADSIGKYFHANIRSAFNSRKA